MSGEELLSARVDADPMGGSAKTSACPRCGEVFQREEDRDVHLERHKPVPDLSKEERVGKVHCAKGCGRWLTPGDAQDEAHTALCDGSPPILERPKKSAYRWWCEAHQFGTNGPKAWGHHKKEHHEGREPVGALKNKRPKGEAIGEILKLLREEAARIEVERVRVVMEAKRVNAAIEALQGDLRSAEEP